MKNISKQLICISIILLLIGVSVSRAISVDTESTISNNESEECKECNEVSDADLIKVERLLNRVEVYRKLLIVLAKHNPEVLEDCKEISNMITTLNKFDLNELICVGLINILKHVLSRFSYCLRKIDEFQKELRIIMVIIYTLIGNVYIALIFVINNIAFKFGCENPYFPDYSEILIE